MSKRGPLNRHTLIALLEDAVELLNDVTARGDSLRRAAKVQEMLMDAVLWLDPARIDQVVDGDVRRRA